MFRPLVFLFLCALTTAVPAAAAGKQSVPPTWTEPVTGMEFVLVRGGCFSMGGATGDPDEKPAHRVCVDDLWIGRTEVTQQQWLALMESNPSLFSRGGRYPVEQVSWHDAQTFLDRLREKGAKSFRLPTEAEWEYACRGTGKGEFCGAPTQSAWIRDSSGGATRPVAERKPNRNGLYDMTGNVWEWVADWYGAEYYRRSPRKNPAGPQSGDSIALVGGQKVDGPFRVLRGGSWSTDPEFARSRFRSFYWPDTRLGDVGFRVAFSPRFVPKLAATGKERP